jgi:hypothetical protein
MTPTLDQLTDLAARLDRRVAELDRDASASSNALVDFELRAKASGLREAADALRALLRPTFTKEPS